MMRFQTIDLEIELCDIFCEDGSVAEFLATDNHKVAIKIFPLEDKLEIEHVPEIKI